MNFAILGRTAVIDNGRSVQLGAAKERGLLGILLLHADEPVKVDMLADLLWPGQGGDTRRSTMYSLVSRIRAMLARLGMPEALEWIRAANSYRLKVDPLDVDLHVFRALVGRAREEFREERYAAAVDSLRTAIELWHGDPIPDLRGDRADTVREGLADELLVARTLFADGLLRTGLRQAASDVLADLVPDHFLDETIARLWITALHSTGRSDEARRHYARFRPRFRRATRTEPDIDIVAILSSAPPAPSARPRQLPTSTKDFLGRTETLGDLDLLTEPAAPGGNLLVLTGMPGVGKTTLALHWSRQRLTRFPDGQLFLDAGTHGPAPVDPHTALARFLHALGVPTGEIPSATDQRQELFNRLLDGRRTLIVLDDVRDSAQAQALIPLEPGCLTIVTSRHSLGRLTVRNAAATLTVRPLPLEDSTTLLSRLIGGPRVEGDPAALVRLARAAHGLPLALRIIGEHVRERPRAELADLADELHRQLLDPVADEDQIDLNTVFSLSYRALAPEMATLFRRLPQHPGTSISAEAAAAMTGGTTETTRSRLNALAKAHLLDHDTAGHYRLHALLHAYAGQVARAEDAASTRTDALLRALDWYLFSAVDAAAVLLPEQPPVNDLRPRDGRPAMHFPGTAAALRWVERERENLTAAIRAAASAGLDRLTWQLQGTVCMLLHRSGRLDGLLELNELALVAARRDGHRIAELGTLLNGGALHLAEHRYDRAEAAALAALRLARDLGAADYAAICTYSLATVLLEQGRTDESVRLLEDALRAFREAADRAGEAFALSRLGDFHRRGGSHEVAAAAYAKSLEILQRLGSHGGEGRLCNNLAALHLEMGRLEAAGHQAEQALATYHLTGDEKARREALTIRADVCRRTGAPTTAIDDARLAAEIATRIDDLPGRAAALAVLADALADTGNHGEAAEASLLGLDLLDAAGGSDIPALRRRLLIGYATSLRKVDN